MLRDIFIGYQRYRLPGEFTLGPRNVPAEPAAGVPTTNIRLRVNGLRATMAGFLNGRPGSPGMKEEKLRSERKGCSEMV
jgi:hypothetical protein